MMVDDPLIEWAPAWAAGKIEGRHTRFNPLDPPQRITMRCLVCGDTRQQNCPSGNARWWITTFATTHRAMHPW